MGFGDVASGITVIAEEITSPVTTPPATAPMPSMTVNGEAFHFIAANVTDYDK